MGYGGFPAEEFCSRLSPAFVAPKMRAYDLGVRKRKIVHRPSLTAFLIFCNKKLLSEPRASTVSIDLPGAALRAGR
jgi:hypothetical protein